MSGLFEFPFARQISSQSASDVRVLQEGTKIPDLVFSFGGLRGLDEKKSDAMYNSEDLFAGRRSLVFHDRLYSASHFRPHLPSYEKFYDLIKAAGIDEVYCASFNDGDVMRQWFISQGCLEDCTPGSLGFKQVKPFPGGGMLFSSAPGDSWSNLNCTAAQGFRRSAAIIDDMKVEKIFGKHCTLGESTEEPLELQTASVLNVLAYLAPSATAPSATKNALCLDIIDSLDELEYGDHSIAAP